MYLDYWYFYKISSTSMLTSPSSMLIPSLYFSSVNTGRPANKNQTMINKKLFCKEFLWDEIGLRLCCEVTENFSVASKIVSVVSMSQTGFTKFTKMTFFILKIDLKKLIFKWKSVEQYKFHIPDNITVVGLPY